MTTAETSPAPEAIARIMTFEEAAQVSGRIILEGVSSQVVTDFVD